MTYSFPETFLFEKRGNIAYMTLNRPEAMNAILPEMKDGLEMAAEIIGGDPEIFVAILSAAGDKAFCSGGDLKVTIPEMSSKGLKLKDPTKKLFGDVTKPIIAAVNGICVAGGFEMLLGTDIRIAVEEASFGVPEVRWSLMPAGGATVRLPRQIPYVRAMELLLVGDRITAQEALQFGLINKVVKREDLMSTAETLAKRICQNGPLAVRKVKESVIRAYNMAWDEAFFTEYVLSRDVFTSEDAKEGPRAFAEKRKPVFKNC
jgi:enoyl-CoA hydratase